MLPHQKVLELIFPSGLLEWFDISDASLEGESVHITLEEKDLPPVTEEHRNKRIIARKFHDITITDFPIRGKRTRLTLRRRYWKIEGEERYLKRDIPIVFPGTQLEKEFGSFLKGEGGRGAGITREDCPIAVPSGQGV